MTLAQRAEQLVDSSAGMRPRSEPGEGVSAARKRQEQREQNDDAPSELGDAAGADLGQRAFQRGFEGLKERPTRGILSTVPPNVHPIWRICCPLV